ncbi:hypothetical protein Tco_0624089 [Tanacetum coccineum]|uniref:Uncharacterized protein n=1 Tax=Tanacetum coccineum TaxID=301880 RepID=A0ABQ4WD13_9ASTR
MLSVEPALPVLLSSKGRALLQKEPTATSKVLKNFISLRDHHVIHKIEIIRECMWIRDAGMFNKSSEKHPIRKSHIGALGYTSHSIDDVVGKIEVLSSGKTVEHVAETNIGVILVSCEAYGIFTENDFPFFEVKDLPFLKFFNICERSD